MRHLLRYIALTFFAFSILSCTWWRTRSGKEAPKPEEVIECEVIDSAALEEAFLDSLISGLSTKEKVAQLIIADLYPKKTDFTPRVDTLVARDKIGGLLVVGDFRDSAELTDRIKELQAKAEIPLLISVDAESSIRKISLPGQFPNARSIGRSAAPDSLAFKAGSDIGKMMKSLDIQADFAPVVDLATNYTDAVGSRSFGKDPAIVAALAARFIDGLQSQGRITCAKHFPGHGACLSDSHFSLSTIWKDKACLDSTDLYPFKKIIEHGVDMVMVGHLIAANVDPSGAPASTSKVFIEDILRKELGFEGVVVTDALLMEGVTKMYGKWAAIEAYKAGADLLLVPKNPREVIEKLSSMIDSGELSVEDLDTHLKRVLRLKIKAI